MSPSVTALLKSKGRVGFSVATRRRNVCGNSWRDLVTGLPKTVTVGSVEIREALEEPISSIIDAIKSTLDRTPPELAADIMGEGIVLAGGGALLRGLDQRLANETGMPIRIATDPLYAVARGSGQALEEFEVLRGVLFSSGDQY